MRIEPTQVESTGPGVKLADHGEAGLSLEMDDPSARRAYAGNTATLRFDLGGYENVVLSFEAKESGDEPHPPRDLAGEAREDEDGESVFGPVADFDFDGVAISADGAAWYEVRGLRNLSSRDFLAIDIDLDEAIAQAGLFYGPEFNIRFCQYDNMPRLMDGIAIHSIKLTGDPLAVDPSLVLHLPMDDRAPNPIVRDRTRNHHQTFLDPGGNPNTDARSTAGAVGTALAFDGVDDYIRLTPESHKPYLAENRDFSIAFWWKADGPDPGGTLHVVGNHSSAANEESCFFYYSSNDAFRIRINEYQPGDVRRVTATFADGTDGTWHHYALVRQGETLRIYQNGELTSSDTHVRNTVGLAPDSQSITLSKVASGSGCRAGHLDDFRIYDRALSAEEVAAMV